MLSSLRAIFFQGICRSDGFPARVDVGGDAPKRPGRVDPARKLIAIIDGPRVTVFFLRTVSLSARKFRIVGWQAIAGQPMSEARQTSRIITKRRRWAAAGRLDRTPIFPGSTATHDEQMN